MKISLVFEHMLISLVGWFVGILTGGTLGYVLALGMRRVFSSSPNSQKLMVLIPWRTVLMISILLTNYPLILATCFGLGSRMGIIAVGITIFLLTLVFSISLLLDHWYPSSLTTRFLAAGRTLITASVVSGVFVGFLGGGGVGFAIKQSMALLKEDIVVQYFGAIVGLVLGFDLVLGIVQYIMLKPSKSQPSSEMKQKEAA